MPGAACKKINLISPRRSPRLKNIRVIYGEHSETNYPTLRPVKTEVIDLEEIASPSNPEFNDDSVGDEDFQNVSLKDLRAQCKAKNRRALKVDSERPDFKNQRQCGKRNLEDEVPKEEVDLDEPIIAFRQKRQKTSPTKSNRTMGKPISLNAVKLQDTTLRREETEPIKLPPLEVTSHDSMSTAEKMERSAADVKHSTIAAGESFLIQTYCSLSIQIPFFQYRCNV